MRTRLPLVRNALAAALLAGSALAAPAFAEDVTLTVWDWKSGDPLAAPYFEKAKEAFEAAHPGVTIEYVMQPHDQYYTVLGTAVTAKQGPDVVLLHGGARTKERTDALVNLTLQNFVQAWNTAKLGNHFVTSVVVTAGSVACLLLVASLAGFGFAVLRFRGRRVLFYLLLATLMIPVQVILVPFYQTMIALDLVNRRIGLIIAYTAFFTRSAST